MRRNCDLCRQRERAKEILTLLGIEPKFITHKIIYDYTTEEVLFAEANKLIYSGRLTEDESKINWYINNEFRTDWVQKLIIQVLKREKNYTNKLKENKL